MSDEPSLHDSWLVLESIMLKRHGEELWSMLCQGMQAAFYMGAFAGASSKLPKDRVIAEAGAGCGDALGIPNMKLIRKDEAGPGGVRG